MSGPDDMTNPPRDGQAEAADPIARLLRAAGTRPSVPPEKAGRVRAAVHQHWRSTIPAPRRSRWLAWSAVPLAVAGAWAFLVASGVWERIQPTSPPVVSVGILERLEGTVSWRERASPVIGAALDPDTAFETGADGRVALRLGGGASVRFGAGSQARLLSAAEVYLEQGAVYVDTGSAPGSGTAVVIRTALGSVRDLGTQFQVRVADDAVRVSVREGSASLEHLGRSHDAASGTQLTLRHDGEVSRRAVPAFGPEWDWAQEAVPPFEIEGRSLGDYLDWVARETGLSLEYADATIVADRPGIVLHGSIASLRPDETLDAVLPTCGLRHRLMNGSVIIERD